MPTRNPVLLQRIQKKAGAKYSRSLKGRYATLRKTAKYTGRVCTLTLNEYTELVQAPCVYCGETLSETGYGLDRKDSSLDYSSGNCVSCCTTCNRFKNNFLTFEEMLAVMTLLKRMRTNGESGCGVTTASTTSE